MSPPQTGRKAIWIDNLQCSKKEAPEQANIAWKRRIEVENRLGRTTVNRFRINNTTMNVTDVEEEKSGQSRPAGIVAKGEIIPLSQLLVTPPSARDSVRH